MTNHTKPEIAIPMKEEIITKLEELLNSENVLSIQKEFNQLSSKFKGFINEELKAAEAALDRELKQDLQEDETVATETDATNQNPESNLASTDDDSTDEISSEELEERTEELVEKAVSVGKAKLSEAQQKIHDKFEEISDVFRAKIKKAVEEKNKIEKETVEKARALLIELKELVANEENIGKSFAVFNEIKDKWKELPKVSNDAYRELNASYNKVVEKFFYNINIYKELKELDLKHNLEEKIKVLEDQKKLLEVNDVRLLEVEVRLNQDRWNEIGPTFKEDWDKLKDEFWAVTREIYKQIQEYYNVRRGEQDKNLERKQELLSRVKYIDGLELKAHKKWQEKTKEIIEIQKEWKMIGFVPKEHSGVLWKEFRTACDHFFEKKRAHYEEIHNEQNKNKEAKLKLLDKAEELKKSEEWDETTEALIKLQKEWKRIGPAHQRDENKLWRKFREACDHFFQAKKGHKVEETGQQSENLTAKEALIEKLNSYVPENKSEGIKQLKEFAVEWRNIGHVPFKEKDKVNKAYKKAMDEKYAELKIDSKQKEQIKFEQKVEDIKVADNTNHLIRKEHDQIRNQLSKLKSEVIQLENNMGFFASSAGADKFKAEIESKIAKAKEEMELLQKRLSVLRKL